jgi:hypothetical protein
MISSYSRRRSQAICMLLQLPPIQNRNHPILFVILMLATIPTQHVAIFSRPNAICISVAACMAISVSHACIAICVSVSAIAMRHHGWALGGWAKRGKELSHSREGLAPSG